MPSAPSDLLLGNNISSLHITAALSRVHLKKIPERRTLRHQLLSAPQTECWTFAYLCWSEWRSCSQAAADAESTLPPGVAAGVCSTSLDDRLCPVYSRGGGMTSLLPEVRAHCRTRPANASHSRVALPDVPPKSIPHVSILRVCLFVD